MPRIPGGGPGMLRYVAAGLVALRRFGVSVWFAMVRFGVTRRPSRIVALCRAAMRRFGVPVWLVMVRFAGVGVRRFASPSPAVE